MKYALVRRHEGQHAIALMCDLLSVSRSGYTEWRDRPTPPRTKADESLLQAIRRIYPRCQTTCRLLYETLGGRKRVDNHDALRQRTEGVGDPQDAGHP